MIFVIQNNSHYLCTVKSLKTETGKTEITDYITKLKTMNKSLFTLVALAMTIVGCASNKSTEPETTKSLVLYYSQTGTTKAVAEELQKHLGADIESIEVENPYNGTYAETIGRCQKEMQTGELPTLKPLQSDISQYNTIYLGYPVWFGTYARPVLTLVEQNKFEGKTVIPFCTFGSGGLNATTNDLRKALPKAIIREGYGVRTARISKMPKELDYFLKKNGLIAGEAAELPDFSEQKPVTEDEKAIFDSACGSYQFPLGTPVTVGSRSIEESTEYKYTVAAKGMDGSDVTTTIYVIDSKEDGAKPEFTQVVR